MRIKLSSLLKGFQALNRLAKEMAKEKSAEPKLAASPEEVKASRFTPGRIRHLREKLGISQRELGILVGASLGAVTTWESGKFKPQGEKKTALVALRKVGKREVEKMLAQKAEEKVEKKIPKPKDRAKVRRIPKKKK